MSATQSKSIADVAKERLLALAAEHPCSRHPLFEALENTKLTIRQAGRLLKNYDAHASVLRRLLLKAATFMPEAAVGYVLENVRNEYGNGDYSKNHQFQLQDVAWRTGVSKHDYAVIPVESGIKRFITEATFYYSPGCGSLPEGMMKAAVAAGAITATEILAIKEFRQLQHAFRAFELEHHIWFHHVAIEEEHTDESLALALYFIEHHHADDSVEYGLRGVLDANMFLYDGLLTCIAARAFEAVP